jgi:L-asparaginase II
MLNPVLVEVGRGGLVESRHRGAVAVVDADGAAVLTLGNVDAPVFPRSAVKALQALPMVEAGAPEKFGFADAELAIASASHGGEAMHVAVVEGMLARIGHGGTALECGAHWPLDQGAAHALARTGLAPTALHNNCSGKHAGFLALAVAMGVDSRGYVKAGHPVQRDVKAAMEALTGVGLAEAPCAVDGCSVPTWAVPLTSLARAFARFATGRGLAPARAAAANRIRAACVARPELLAGTGRFCTQLMEALGGRIFLKTGAEGVMCAALTDRGFGVAVKCDDGAGRAAEVMVAAALARLLPQDAVAQSVLASFVRPTLRNWNGITVGGIAPTAVLLPDGPSTSH